MCSSPPARRTWKLAQPLCHELLVNLLCSSGTVVNRWQTQELKTTSCLEEQKDSLAEILRAGQHLLALIGDVLDITKAENQGLSLSTEQVNVSEVVEESVSLVKLLAAERQIDLQVALVSNMTVTADRQALKEILVNLLSNAVKYNREGGVICISAAPTETDRLRISIEDTGIGIPPDMLERVFTAFDRVGAETTSVQGSGLGLALAKRLAEAMDGDLTVESTPGVGSIFAIELPGRLGDLHLSPGGMRDSAILDRDT